MHKSDINSLTTSLLAGYLLVINHIRCFVFILFAFIQSAGQSSYNSFTNRHLLVIFCSKFAFVASIIHSVVLVDPLPFPVGHLT